MTLTIDFSPRDFSLLFKGRQRTATLTHSVAPGIAPGQQRATGRKEEPKKYVKACWKFTSGFSFHSSKDLSRRHRTTCFSVALSQAQTPVIVPRRQEKTQKKQKSVSKIFTSITRFRLYIFWRRF
jgi:hypothetical protein